MAEHSTAQRADALIAKMKAARGYIYPEWEFAARQDPEFVETYNRIYELGLGEGKHVSAKVREFVAIALLAFRGSERAGLVAHMERGIGGLAAALSLLEAGCDVQVFEQAPALTEVGAGIQISPNASRLLHLLGLGPALARCGVRPAAFHQRRWDDGRTLQRAVLGEAIEAEFGAPYYPFHRADLLAALAGALPQGRVHLGHRLAGFTDHGDRVDLRFANGARAATDVLVGADGIHSTVRAALFGPERPRFTGCVAYRGLVPAERLKHLGLEIASNSWLGPGGHFVHYFVAGRRLVNFVAIME